MRKLFELIISFFKFIFGVIWSIWDLLPKGFGKKFLFFFSIGIAVICGLLVQILLQLPDVSMISAYIPSETTEIFSADGVLLARLHEEENRVVVPLSKISKTLQKIVIIMEDEKFYSHHGFDLEGIGRATLANITKGRIVQGGSTITQQLARNLFLTKRRTFTRKLAELLLAIQIERQYTKDEILELYLNQIYWGHNAYGVESAANFYFNKHASELNLGECALLAGIMDGPELYSPYRNSEGAKMRQVVVLERLKEKGLITEKQALYYQLKPLALAQERPKKYGYRYPYFTSHVISELINKYGEDTVYKGGLRVYTTLDTGMQRIADWVTRKYVSEEGEAYNFSQVALISLDPRTGYIKAMVGGISYEASEFNRTTQARRQPGSSFKPYVYTAALELGFSPGFIIDDSPVTFEVPATEWNPEGMWSPRNFDERFRGNITMRLALVNSLNVPSVKLLDMIGVQATLNVARKMGIQSPLKRNLGLTLGVSEITLLEHTSAFGVFANSGIRVKPAAILRVETRDGAVLYKHVIRERRVLDTNVAATIRYMMQGVLVEGTGVRGRIDRPSGAKTGTSQEYKDAWFIGYVPQLTTGVWVGNDDNTPMEGVTEVAVCPRMWKTFMVNVLTGVPTAEFPKPQGLVSIEVCLDSGGVSTQYCPSERIISALYWWDKVPEDECEIHKEPDWFWNPPFFHRNIPKTTEVEEM
jgi:penicillin-binding protein 1A